MVRTRRSGPVAVSTPTPSPAPITPKRTRPTKSSSAIKIEPIEENALNLSTPRRSGRTASTTTKSKQKQKKKVRFSDPGPSISEVRDDAEDGDERMQDGLVSVSVSASTGLTPCLRRATITPMSLDDGEVPSSPVPAQKRLLNRVPRRRCSSTPVRTIEGVDTGNENSNGAGTGTGTKRARDEDVRSARAVSEGEVTAAKGNAVRKNTDRVKISYLEMEIERLKMELMEQAKRVQQRQGEADVGEQTILDDDDTLPFDIEDSAIIASTPERVLQTVEVSGKDKTMIHAGVQATSDDTTTSSEMQNLITALETAKSEKRALFKAWRQHSSPTSQAADRRSESPPPDFLPQILQSLTSASTRAAAAEQTLQILNTEIQTLGFPGSNTDAILSEIKSQFRRARLDLERAVPGETESGFDDNSTLLSAMTSQINALVEKVRLREKDVCEWKSRENALRTQFDDSLFRLEKANGGLRRLEEQLDENSQDMLYARQSIQTLKRDEEERKLSLERMGIALEAYRRENKNLEALIMKLEEEGKALGAEEVKKKMNEANEALERERQARVDSESRAADYRAQLADLESKYGFETARVEALLSEIDALRSKDEELASNHEQHISGMNVRLASLTTSLDAANHELTSLRAIKAKLESRLRIELEQSQRAVEDMLSEAVRSVSKIAECKKSYLRGAKVRDANAKIEMEGEGEQLGVGSGEQLVATPQSLVRFKDVEVGRGKKRRRFDSGIGILEEEMEMSDEEAVGEAESDAVGEEDMEL